MLRAPDGGDLEETAAVTFTVTGSETAVAVGAVVPREDLGNGLDVHDGVAAMVEAVAHDVPKGLGGR